MFVDIHRYMYQFMVYIYIHIVFACHSSECLRGVMKGPLFPLVLCSSRICVFYNRKCSFALWKPLVCFFGEVFITLGCH